MNRPPLWQRLKQAGAVIVSFDVVTPTLLAMCCFTTSGEAQQVPDRDFDPPIGTPSFERGAGPVVVIDAAHVNFHTMEGRYQSFARLLEKDGYRVRANSAPFTAASLQAMDILVISNAMHEQSSEGFAPLPNLSAFTDEEIAAVEGWVADGGSLMLIADHMPIAGHAAALGAAFGMRFYNGFVFEADGRGGVGIITFRRSDGSLLPSVAVEGRGPADQVDSVTAFTGQAFRMDPGVEGMPLMSIPDGYDVLLPTVAWQFSESTPRVPAANLLQGALVRHGLGRIAVFGEAAMFSAQRQGPEERPMGMNDPVAAQNYLFALNVMRWLAEAGR